MSLLKIPSFLQVQVLLTVFILNTCTTVVYVIFSKNSSQSFHAKRGAKVRIFIFIFQIFSKFFSIYFSGRPPGGYRISAWILPTSSSFLAGSLTPSIMLSHASLSIAGAKVLLYNISSKSFYHFFSIIFCFS